MGGKEVTSHQTIKFAEAFETVGGVGMFTFTSYIIAPTRPPKLKGPPLGPSKSWSREEQKLKLGELSFMLARTCI